VAHRHHGDPPARRDSRLHACGRRQLGQFSAIGRFVPQNLGSPPYDFRFELLHLEVVSGNIEVVSLPEPSTLTLSLISLTGVAMRRRWQAARRTRTHAR
jgi:hypothetical protein